MEEFGLRCSAAASSIEAKQSKLKEDLARNDESYASIKSSLNSIVAAAVNSKASKEDQAQDSDSDDNSSTCTVIDRRDVHQEITKEDEKYITMQKFLSLVSEGKIHDDVMNEIYLLNGKLEVTKKEADDLHAKFSVLQSDLNEIKREINSIKQYIKIENLLFHNFYLPPGYKHMSSLQFSYFMAQQINYLIPQLDYPVSWEHISTAHPLKTKRKKSNVIVVRFCNRNIRDEIFAKRHFISKKGCGITEHLTENNLEVFKKAKSIFGFNNVSTMNCNVFVNVNGVQRIVRSIEHVNELFESSTINADPSYTPSRRRGSYGGGNNMRRGYSVRNRHY